MIRRRAVHCIATQYLPGPAKQSIEPPPELLFPDGNTQGDRF
jgi:hypothetical protein